MFLCLFDCLCASLCVWMSSIILGYASLGGCISVNTFKHMCMYVCSSECLSVCIFVCLYVRALVYVCLCVCLSVSVSVCAWVCLCDRGRRRIK